jgi:peptidoglycan/LPS O-acetylase OafA/YrhL
MLVGMDRATSQIILGFVLVLLGGFVMAIISQKIAMEANAGYLIAGGAAAGFVAACMIPTSTGTLWPQWLLLIAGILTVVIAVGFFLKQSNTGG